jgi:phosphate starvation-inducible PhoH-like protein
MSLFGRHDENLRLIEDAGKVTISLKDGFLRIKGDEPGVETSRRVMEELLTVIRKGQIIRRHDVQYTLKAITQDPGAMVSGIYEDKIEVASKRHFITPKSIGQKAYVDAIKKHDIVFAIGPAGTGKTYLAVARAGNAHRQKDSIRIIVPSSRRGRRIFGFLPGDT